MSPVPGDEPPRRTFRARRTVPSVRGRPRFRKPAPPDGGAKPGALSRLPVIAGGPIVAPWTTESGPIHTQPETGKMIKCSEILNSGGWAIQDSNLGPLPYQRKAMPRCGRKCPVFIEVSEASAAVKWREMFRQSSVTPAARAPARAARPWRRAVCSSALPSFVGAGAEPRSQRRTATDWQVRSLGADAGVLERRMASTPTRPWQMRLTRSSPRRRRGAVRGGVQAWAGVRVELSPPSAGPATASGRRKRLGSDRRRRAGRDRRGRWSDRPGRAAGASDGRAVARRSSLGPPGRPQPRRRPVRGRGSPSARRAGGGGVEAAALAPVWRARRYRQRRDRPDRPRVRDRVQDAHVRPTPPGPRPADGGVALSASAALVPTRSAPGAVRGPRPRV